MGTFASLDSLTHWLEFTLDVPAQATVGTPVELALKVRNRSDAPVKFFHGTDPYDFALLDANGAEVWHWSRWRGFDDILLNTTLQPGEVKEYKVTWDRHDQDCTPPPRTFGLPCQGNPVPAGTYRVVATFEAALSNHYMEYKETVNAEGKAVVIVP